MSFDLVRWRATVQQDVEQFAQNPVAALNYAGITSFYGFLLGSAVFPIVAAYTVDPQSALTTLLSVVGSIGGNLASNWIQGKYDKLRTCAVAVEESQQPELAPIYEAIAKQVDLFPLANQALLKAGNPSVAEKLRNELVHYGKLDLYLSDIPSIHQSGALNIANSTFSNNSGPIIGSVSSGRDTIIGTTFSINNIGDNNVQRSSSRQDTENGGARSMHNVDHLRNLRSRHVLRLQSLELQANSLGLTTPSEIVREIADLRNEIERLDQLLKESQ